MLNFPGHDRSPSRTALLAGSTAVAAAATALWARHRALRAERAYPPIGQFMEIDGVRLHYVDSGGAGPAVVLLHGNAVQMQDYLASGLYRRLVASHRVIAFDRPGFGFSTRPRNRVWTPAAQAALIDRALARLRVDRPVIVGHSWGAMVALALGLEHPASVSGLVLASGYYYPTLRLDVLPNLPVVLPLLGDALRYTVSPIAARLSLGHMVKAMFAPLPVPEHFFDAQPRELLVRPSQIRADAEDGVFMMPAAAAMRPRYRELRMPVQIFAGTDDRVVDPDAHAVRLHRELAQSRLHLVRGVGHMVHYAVPEQIAEAVLLMRDPGRTEDAGRSLHETSVPDGSVAGRALVPSMSQYATDR